jgi:hypothetical protein
MTDDQGSLSVHAAVVDLSRHDGGLRPVVGTISTQVLRANRERPDLSDGYGWTYNHAPMLAWWNNQFYLEYLSTPVSEHVGPGQTLLITSPDGTEWGSPVVIFPQYVIPDGVYQNPSDHALPSGSRAVMHQRMGFYTAPDGRLLVLGFYGICPHYRVFPNDGNGIGRVVREIGRDGSFGDIYFIRYNTHAGWDENNTRYPLYTSAPDAGFVAACDALLADPAVTMQWWEEDRSTDGFFSVAGERAPSRYELPDGRLAAIWKSARAALSADGGRTWSTVEDVPGMVTAGGKAWGQRTADGRYALVYNPSPTGKMRWPLAVATSADGLRFSELLAVNGEVPPRRYDGLLKDYGLSYVRGIETSAGGPDDAMWLTYSANKEDIWVSRVPVPLTATVTEAVDDHFDQRGDRGLWQWNIHRAPWSPVTVEPGPAGGGCLRLGQHDRYGHATAERVFPESTGVVVEWSFLAQQEGGPPLYMELCDRRGAFPVRVVLGADGRIAYLNQGDYEELAVYRANEWIAARLELDVPRQRYRLTVAGTTVAQPFLAPVASVERFALRTGPPWTTPDLETPMQSTDLDGAGSPIAGGEFLVDWVRTSGHRFERWADDGH